MFKKLLLLVVGGLALREAQKRGYLDKLPSGLAGKLPFPTSGTAPMGGLSTTPAASPMSNGSTPAL
jgi:hypothetical protein